MPENNATNQRVTNAQLKSKIDFLTQRVEEMRNELADEKKVTTKRLVVVESHVIKCATLWDKHDKKHDELNDDLREVKKDVKRWSTVTGTAGGIFAILGSIFMDR